MASSLPVLAAYAHQLRRPLTTIRAATHNLLRSDDSPERSAPTNQPERAHLEVIASHIEQLLMTTDEMLNMASMYSGENAPVEVRPLPLQRFDHTPDGSACANEFVDAPAGASAANPCAAVLAAPHFAAGESWQIAQMPALEPIHFPPAAEGDVIKIPGLNLESVLQSEFGEVTVVDETLASLHNLFVPARGQQRTVVVEQGSLMPLLAAE